MDTVGNVERALLAELRKGQTAETSRLLARVLANNRIVLHNYQAPAIKDCGCDLEGCGNRFSVVLIPNQVVYPRFCRDHRTEHRRTIHRERFAHA